MISPSTLIVRGLVEAWSDVLEKPHDTCLVLTLQDTQHVVRGPSGKEWGTVIFCHTQVMEDAQVTYVLPNATHYNMFQKLIRLDKVGPAAAIKILSKTTPQEIEAQPDKASLVKLIGKAGEQLWDKLEKRSAPPSKTSSSVVEAAAQAVSALGIKITDARARAKAVVDAATKPLTEEEIIKACLKTK